MKKLGTILFILLLASAFYMMLSSVIDLPMPAFIEKGQRDYAEQKVKNDPFIRYAIATQNQKDSLKAQNDSLRKELNKLKK